MLTFPVHTFLRKKMFEINVRKRKHANECILDFSICKFALIIANSLLHVADISQLSLSTQPIIQHLISFLDP